MQQCVLVFSKTSTMKLWGLLFNKAAICSSIRCLFLKQETMSSHSIEHPGPPLFRASFAPVCEGSSTHRYMKTSFFLTVCPLTTGDMVAGIELLHAVLGYLISIAGITPQIWLGLLKEVRLERARTWTCDCSLGKATVWIGNGSLAW